MNQFIEQLDNLVEEQGLTEQQENDLIDHIFNTSVYQDANDFALANLNYWDGLNLVQSDDHYPTAVAEWLENQPLGMSEQFVEHLSESTKSVESIVYTLAYEHTELGTKLLDELLYYRSKGRL